MLVNVLNICSDDELVSDTDDTLEEGEIHSLKHIHHQPKCRFDSICVTTQYLWSTNNLCSLPSLCVSTTNIELISLPSTLSKPTMRTHNIYTICACSGQIDRQKTTRFLQSVSPLCIVCVLTWMAPLQPTVRQAKSILDQPS